MLKKLLLATMAMFMMFAAPAHAGPLVGGIGALIGGIAGSGLSLGSIALGIFSMGAQWLISMLLAPEVEQKGVKTKIDTGGDNPPAFILGEYCTAGQLVYANVFDKSGYNIENACLVYVIQISCIPVNGLSNIVFANNERVTINPGTNWNGFMQVDEYVKGASGGGYFLVKFYDGTQNTADSWLLDKFGSDPDRPWQSDMIGRGCAYVIVQAWYSNRGIWTGLPDLRWVVQGASLYDPRKDSTVGGSGSQRRNNSSTWTFSKNAKVIEYNTHIGIRYAGDHLWGGDAEPYRLPLDYWFAAMNACDENVAKAAGGTVKRYEVGCEIHLNDKPIDIINEINKSCSGYTTEFGGTYKTWCGGPGLPVGSITDDDFLITAEQETNKFQSQQATFNTAYATYPEPKQQWEPKDGPRYQDSDALDEDGEELPLDMTLPFVTENNQVQRLMRLAIKDSRRQVTHEGHLPPIAWVYEPFDCLTYYSDMFGYGVSGKDFIVASKDDLPNVNQRVLLREVNANDQGWLPEYEQSFDTAPLVIVTPGTLVLDVDVFADQVDTTAGKDKPAIRVDWTWATAELDVQRLKWEVRYPSTTKVIAEGTINNPANGSALVTHDVLRFGKAYEIRFMGIPYAIRDADWTGWKSVTCVIVDVPTAPSLSRVSKLGSDGRLSYFVDVAWTAVAQESTYVVRMVVDGTATIYPAAASPLRIPVAAGASLVVDVAAVGSDTTRSNYSATTSLTITKKNTAPTAPTSLTATGKIGRIDYKTNKNPDSDFDHFNLYASNTNDFTTAVLVDDSRSIQLQEGNLGNDVTRYSWITAVDSSGNESSKFPVSNTAGRTATTTRVASADIDDGAVTDAKTDQTAPGTPAAPTLSTFAADIDGDGTIDTGLTLSIVAPAGVKVVGYEVQKFASATLGGTYVAKGERFQIPAEDPNTAGTVTSYDFRANQAKFWKIRARAIAYNGKKGTWSSQTATGVSPLGWSATLTASAPSVSAIANGYRYAWTKPSDKAYKETEILVNGVALTRVNGTSYVDTTTRTVGATPTITVRHYDKSDNVGTVSSGTVAPAYRLAASGEVGILVAGNLPLEPSQIIMNPTFTGGVPDGWDTLDPSYTFVRARAFAGVPADAPADYVLEYNTATYATDLYWKTWTPVEPGEVYYLECMLETDGLVVDNFIIGLHSKDLTLAGNTWTAGLTLSAATGNALTTWTKFSALVTVPAVVGAVKTGYSRAWFSCRGNVAPAGKWYGTKFRMRKATQGEIANGAVTDVKTDQTAPAVPSAPALTQVAKDVDEDGKVDIAIKVTWSAVTGAKLYEIEITQGSDVWYETTKNRSLLVKAKSNKLYSIKVSAISFNGTASAFSTATTFTPSKKSTTPATPGGLTAVQKSNAIRLDWTASTEADFKWAFIYRNTTNTPGTATRIGRTKADWHRDDAALTFGTTYYYWVSFVDTSDNEGAKSSVASAIYNGVLTAHVAPAAITSPLIDDAAVTTPKIGANQVTAAKWLYEDETSLIKNPNMDDITLFVASATGGTISTFTTAGQASTDGCSKNALTATSSGGTTSTKIMTLPDIPVRPGFMYRVEGYVGPTVAAIVNRKLRAEFYSMDSSGNLVFDSGVDLTYPGVLPGGPLGPYNLYGDVIVPANCVRMALGGYVDGASCVVHTLIAQRKTVSSGDNLVVGPTGTFGTTETTLVSLTLSHGAGVKALMINGACKNVAGASKTATIRLKINGGTRTYRQSVDLRDNEFQEIFAVDPLPAGPTSTIALTYEGAAGSNNISQAWIQAVAIS